METSKQKAIREAYGKYWDEVKDFVTEDGWCKTRKRINYDEIIKSLSIELYNESTYNWRPKSLQGIETNNGWIKIESEADLPSEIDYYWIKDKSGSIEICKYYGKEDLAYRVWITQFIHYHPIIKPQQPIY